MVNLTSKLTVGIAHDRAGNNRTSDSASTTQSNLRRNKDVGDILVLTKERNVENDLKGLSIRSHHDEGALTTIQSLRSYIHNQLSTHTFIGSLLQPSFHKTHWCALYFFQIRLLALGRQEKHCLPMYLLALPSIQCSAHRGWSVAVVQPLSQAWLFVTHGLQHARLPCPSLYICVYIYI